MAVPHVMIVRAPGTNCDQETAFAFQQAGAHAEVVHLNRVLEQPALFDKYQILCIPGGFSYGDDIGAGKIFATQMRHHLSEMLGEFKSRDKLILGICNGFQVLIKSGILFPDGPRGPVATLTWNDCGQFQDRWVDVRVTHSQCVFLKGIERMYLPIAHAEGKFVVSDPAQLRAWDAAGQLTLRYGAAESAGEEELPFPQNPNGSMANVAGVCDDTGRVFGLMPHPERHIDPTHHPRWTRLPPRERGDGLAVFENAVRFFAD